MQVLAYFFEHLKEKVPNRQFCYYLHTKCEGLVTKEILDRLKVYYYPKLSVPTVLNFQY